MCYGEKRRVAKGGRKPTVQCTEEEGDCLQAQFSPGYVLGESACVTPTGLGSLPVDSNI